MYVADLEPSTDREYDAFLAGQEGALLYHCAAFRDLLRDVTGGRSRYLAAFDQDRSIRGVLPLFEMDGPRGTVLNSLPFYGSNGGVLASSAAARDALIASYNRLVAVSGIAASTIVANPLVNDALEDAAHEFTDQRTGQFSPLDAEGDPQETLMSRFHYKTRNMVRKAAKLGVDVRVDNDAFDALRKIHAENMSALGGVAKPDVFFESLRARFRADRGYRVYVGRFGGETIAALLLLYFGTVVEYYIPVVRREFRDLQPLSLIIFRAMVDAAREGYRWWNWGGTWPAQLSLYRFKSRWGTVDKPYVYRTKVNDRGILAASSQTLRAEYPYCYVVPFQVLSEARS